MTTGGGAGDEGGWVALRIYAAPKYKRRTELERGELYCITPCGVFPISCGLVAPWAVNLIELTLPLGLRAVRDRNNVLRPACGIRPASENQRIPRMTVKSRPRIPDAVRTTIKAVVMAGDNSPLLIKA
jgi:hypothetical protein